MKRRIPILLVPLAGLLALCLVDRPAPAYVEALYPLAKVVKESTNIVLVKVDKVNKERKLIYYKKVADLKGTHPDNDIRHNVGVGGFNAFEQKAPIEWAEVGKLAIFFHNGGASETCIGKYWYQCYAGGAWWNHSHGEPYLCRSYCGDIEGLKTAVEKLIKGEEVIVPATVSKTDLRIQKVKTSLAKSEDYIVVEPPAIERTKLENVAGFSDMIELPRPEGQMHGAIAIDVDGDGFLDLLLIGTGGMRLLRNNQKGNFEDVTAKWGLAEAPGCLAAAFADYNRSGRPSLFTSLGRLYTNLGDKFRDDTDKLPATPKRVSNPGEAFAWIDINGDGLPDLVSTLGVQGLTAWINKGGKDKQLFEDVSGKIGLGEGGLGQEPANFLTTLDLNQDGKPDFILNLKSPLVALNRDGRFVEEKSSGLSFPCLGRPSISAADYRNNGKMGLFVTTSDRPGALLDWQMIGTFSAEEDAALKAGPDFNPTDRPEVKIDKDSWDWKAIKAEGNGVLEAGRRSPSPNSCYAFTTFDWPAAEKIALHIGSLNGLTVWLNGKQVYEHKEKRPFVPDTDKIEVEAKKGSNRLLLKVMDDGPVWKTSIRPAPWGLYPPPAVRLYEGDGQGKFTDVTLKAGDLAQLRAESVSAVWGDINNDGHLDLIVVCKTGLVRVYLSRGDGTFRYSTAELGLEQKFKASGALLADFNNNGLLDLVLINDNPDPCTVLFSKIKPKWAPLTVRFAGPDSPIGATVKVLDASGKLCGTRYIAGGDGRNMQATPEARFVLAPGKYRVVTRYSSGKMCTSEVQLADKPKWIKMDDKTP
jgi:hypothetical protein